MKRNYVAAVLALGMMVHAGSLAIVYAAEDSLEAVLDVSDADAAGYDDLLSIASAPETDLQEDAGQSNPGTVAKEGAKGASLDDVKGLIEGARQETISRDLSDGLSWDELKEEEEESARPPHIPGFTVDPNQYPAANITENTEDVYWYLIDEMELSHAAACGVLANIQLESNFRPLAIGDGGTSFGICQWHLGRLSNLIAFCKEEELDYHTLEGQLAYLQYELEGGYSGVLLALQEVEDTEEGAYEAGYQFCMGFEKPDQTMLRAQRRGNLAKNEYFEREFERSEEEDEENEEEKPAFFLGEEPFDLEAFREKLVEKVWEMME